MGRKGLGKLAGFGIARIVEVRTVRKGWLTHFAMDFNDMTNESHSALVSEYRPQIKADEPTDEPNGTTIILKSLLLSRAIVESEFVPAMERRFAILGQGFRVLINGEPLERYELALQFRFEGASGGWEDVTGVGSIRWWMGFTERPIQVETARGVSIMVRDKMAQAPFFFDLSGGAYGQAGMQYMTGEVYADQLDEANDYIGTDRQGILWTEPMPEALLKWGEAKVRDLLREWARLRSEANERELVATVTAINESVETRLKRLAPSEEREARELIKTIATLDSVTNEPERARELLDMVLRAFEDSSFFALLKALSAADHQAREQILKLVTELDIFETVRMAEVVRARVGVIRKFRQMIAADVREKPDMQDFLFDHPWLIDPEWQIVEHERALESMLIEHFKIEPEQDPSRDRRVDFFCVSTRGRYLVVEVKRPGLTIGATEVQQIIDYVTYLRSQAPTSGQARHPNFYEGVLVGHHVSPGGERWRDVAANSGVTVRPWSELLDVAERIHREFLEAVKQRAPEDPRVQDLPELPEHAAQDEHTALA
jgi:hypothetical protein